VVLTSSLRRPDENFDAARLVHEVSCAPVECKRFTLIERMTCQKDDRQVEAALAQLRQQYNAGGGSRLQSSMTRSASLATSSAARSAVPLANPWTEKASLFQLPTERFPEIVVVLNEEDANRPLRQSISTGCSAATLWSFCSRLNSNWVRLSRGVNSVAYAVTYRRHAKHPRRLAR